MKTLSTYKRSLWRYILLALWLCGTFTAWGQTVLERGDVAILGVNAKNGGCSDDNDGSEDIISVVFFKDITTGTQIALTDNGYISSGDNFRNTEGYLKIQYDGADTISAGTIIRFKLSQESYKIMSLHPIHDNWNIIEDSRSLTLNNGGDQLYFLSPQDNWNNGNFNGEVLYGFSTSNWVTFNPGNSQQSNLHPHVIPCNYMNPATQTDFLIYVGDTSPATQLVWIYRIKDLSNWGYFENCTDYNNANALLEDIVILENDVTLSVSPLNLCEPGEVSLTFDISDSSQAYDIVYTDGSQNYSLNTIIGSRVEDIHITGTTTFSLVSANLSNDPDSCPVYSDLTMQSVTVEVGSYTPNPIPVIHPDYYMCEGNAFSMSNIPELVELLAEYDVSLIHTDTGARLDLWLEDDSFSFSEVREIIENYDAQPGFYQVLIYPLDHGDNNQGSPIGFEINPGCHYEYPGGTYLTIYTPEAGNFVNPQTTEFCVGETFTLSTENGFPGITNQDGHGNDIDNYRVSWSSSNTSVASIDENTGEITALEPGTTTISYTVKNPIINNQFTFLPEGLRSCESTISIEITVVDSPDAGVITISDELCLGVDGYTATTSGDSGGTWSSSNQDVLTIDVYGNITTISAGVSTVKYELTGEDPCDSTVYVEKEVEVVGPVFNNLPEWVCYMSEEDYPLPIDDEFVGEWFLHQSATYIPVSSIDTSAPGIQNLVYIADYGDCEIRFLYNVDVRRGSDLSLRDENGNAIFDNVIVLGDNTNYIEVEPSGGILEVSDSNLLTVNNSTGVVTTNSNGLTGMVTITHTGGPNSCTSKIDVYIIDQNLPGGVIHPTIWMKADEINSSRLLVELENGKVSEWKNEISLRAVTQGVPSKRPSYIQNNEKPFNYHRFLKFNQAQSQSLFRDSDLDRLNEIRSTFFTISTAQSDQNSTMMSYRSQWNKSYVHRPSANVQTQSLDITRLYNRISLNTGAEAHDLYYSDNVARIIGSKSSGNQLKAMRNELVLNNISNISSDFLPEEAAKFTIGARDKVFEYSDDAVSEVIAYGRVLTTNEIQRVKTYLAIKYGISFNPLTNDATNVYIDSQSNLIFDPEDHVGFNHNITIVGRDNTGINTDAEEANKDLFQKQSRSVNDNGLLTLYVDNSVEQNTLFNSENSISVNYPNRNFFVIADNDAALTLTCQADGFQRLERVWEMTQVGNHPRVSIGFDPTELPEEVTSLLVSSDPSFPANNTSVLELNNYTGGTASAKKGYVFDSSDSNLEDVPNGKYFTFGNVITPSFSFETSYCKGDTPVALPTTSENGVEGTWSPSSINTSQPGSYSYVFTPSDGNCGLPVTITVEITEDVVSFNNLNLTGHCVYSNVSLDLEDDNGVVGHWEDADGNDLGNSFTSTTAGDVIIYFVPDTSEAGCYARTAFTFTFISCPCPELEITIQATEPICADSSIELTAIIMGDAGFDRWETSGDGSFSDPNNNETFYTPSPEDILNNEVIITAFTTAPNTNNPNCGPVSDSETIIIISKEIAEFEQLEFNICEGEEFILPSPTNNVDGVWSPAVYSGEGGYVFTPIADCNETTTISVYEHALPQVDSPENVVSCTSYELPILTHGSYFTGTNGTGTQLSAGDIITSSQTIYVYAETGGSTNCSAETSFEITIVDLPEVDILDDVIVCESYELPSLSHGNYYTEPDGAGTELNAGDLITSSQTIYIYAETGGIPNCSNESSFDVTIKQMAEIVFESLPDVSICGNMSLPDVDSLDSEDDNNVAGTWSVVENNNVYTYTFTPTNECYEAYSFTVSVEEVITPNFVIPPSQCEGESFPLGNESPNGITGTWYPAFDPYNTTTYTFTPDAGQCASTQEVTIIIKDKPITSPIQLLN